MKWEYKTTHLVTGDDALEKLGAEGWEMCGVLPNIKAYFKRPVTAGPFIKREIIIGKKEKWESDIYTPAGKEVLFKQETKKKKELLSQFRSMVLELIEAGNMIPSEVKKKAYDLIDSCYDEDGELIA